MPGRDSLAGAMAAATGGVEARMKDAINRILDLVWDARSDKFAFADNEDVDAEVNRILALMSDGMLDDARRAAEALLKTVEMDDWEEDAMEYAGGEVAGEDALFRFDMQASHLKELLEGWIVVAAVYGLSKARVWTDLMTFMSNPMASRMWRGAGVKMPSWGRGYLTNLVAAYRRLIRDFMMRAYSYAELHKYARDGAIGYTVHRGSAFDCPLCDSYCGRVYPLDAVVLPVHVNCMCYTEPVFREGD